MNAKLRRRHRAITALLAVLLSVGVSAGLACRDQSAGPKREPTTGSHAKGSREGEVGKRLAGPLELEGLDVSASLFECPPPFEGQVWILELAHAAGQARPDVLAYLTPGPPSTDEFLPLEAQPLGRLPVGDTRRFQLDSPPTGKEYLLLVSLAHGERIGAAHLPFGP